MRQRADQHERRLAPRRVSCSSSQSHWISSPGGCSISTVDRVAAAVLADQADRPQLKPPQLAHQRRIGALEARRRRARDAAPSPPGAGRRRSAPRCRRGTAPGSSAPAAAPTDAPAPRRGTCATVLRSRPVWRLIADTDQPRAASAWISTSSSSVSIPAGPPDPGSQASSTRDPAGGPRQNRARAWEATPARPYGPSPPSLPTRASTRYRGGEFR